MKNVAGPAGPPRPIKSQRSMLRQSLKIATRARLLPGTFCTHLEPFSTLAVSGSGSSSSPKSVSVPPKKETGGGFWREEIRRCRQFSSSSPPVIVNPVSFIADKRAGIAHTPSSIASFVDGFHQGQIEDYQVTAWLMAVCLNGCSAEETAALTKAMVNSGDVADLSDVPGTSVDKHSTGGVGDKISLILAPLVASFGLVVPMMSGRGLGHTGGTLDKLESIPGFNVDLSMSEFKSILRSTKVAMVSPAGDMAPVDKKIYALRDVTSTVRSIPLQTSSIMCKKIAENPESLVLDVKFGKGAFNQDKEER